MDLNFNGLIIGIASFLIIGVFHPLVIKGEYYLGLRCVWIFVILGVVSLAVSLMSDDDILSILSGVFSFSSFWGVKEVYEQRRRVEKGWFPKNPKRKY